MKLSLCKSKACVGKATLRPCTAGLADRSVGSSTAVSTGHWLLALPRRRAAPLRYSVRVAPVNRRGLPMKPAAMRLSSSRLLASASATAMSRSPASDIRLTSALLPVRIFSTESVLCAVMVTLPGAAMFLTVRPAMASPSRFTSVRFKLPLSALALNSSTASTMAAMLLALRLSARVSISGTSAGPGLGTLMAPEAIKLTWPRAPVRIAAPASSAGSVSKLMLPAAVTTTRPLARRPLCSSVHSVAVRPVSTTRSMRRSATAPISKLPSAYR